MGKGGFSWAFIIVIAVGALWILSKVSGSPGIFSGISSQRGLQGTDQFTPIGGS